VINPPRRMGRGGKPRGERSMSKRTLEQIEADVEVAIASQQPRMQCLTPDDDARCIVEDMDPALLREFGEVLVLRAVERMIEADCERLVAAGQAHRHKNGRYYRRYDAAPSAA
jgi:hypothetical protein